MKKDMAHLAPVHYKKFDKFLRYIGCEFIRQRGDHRIYQRADLKRPIVIPADKGIPIFIIRNNLRLLGINSDEYLKILSEL